MDEQEYLKLLAKWPLRVIKTEAENEYWLGVFKELTEPETNTEAEYVFMETLSIIIQEFESRAYPIPEVSDEQLRKDYKEYSKFCEVDV